MEALLQTDIVRCDDDLIAMAKCIKNVDMLKLEKEFMHFGFTPKGIQALSDGILKRDNPVSATYCDI